MIDRKLSIAIFFEDISLLLITVGMTIILSILAGIYPAFILSGFNTLDVLHGLKVRMKSSLTKSGLIVLQFALAIGMIVSTLVVIQQLNYIKTKDIGFSKDHMLLVDMNVQSNRNYQNIKNELAKKPTILGVTASGQRIGNNFH